MRHVFQTAGDPPSIGRTILAKSGSIQKSRKALESVVAAKRASIRRPIARP
jgi:hypothetical protein